MTQVKHLMCDDAAEISFSIPVCPLCKTSGQVIPIAYGLPNLEMFEEAELGKIFLGGCLITEDMPLYHCKRDGLSF